MDVMCDFRGLIKVTATYKIKSASECLKERETVLKVRIKFSNQKKRKVAHLFIKRDLSQIKGNEE